MKLTYRPEIDGLRAIAIGAVIFYHAQINIFGFQLFRGGFIGVDIFFVISGYLITSIILKELVTTGSFSFKNFYERRVRRILPALLFVMLVSLPFAWMYLLPNNFVDFSKSILYSLGFSSNFYFHYSSQQYGAESGLFKPFLHTWSLSVEEQYYILFPIVLLIIFKYFRKYLIHILIFAFFVSLGLADWGSRNHPSFNFYVLPTRVWELLAGSILAYFEIRSGHRSKHQALNLILPTIGLLLISHSILFFDDKMFHPSFYTLSPIIGVCLIIWFSNLNEITTKVLSTKLFVSIGLISYSLYLWHYPIFAFARISEFMEGNFVNKIFIGFAILSFSIISYYCVERPSRNKQYKTLFIIPTILFCIFFLTIININIISKDGYAKRIAEILQKNLSEKPWNLLKNEDNVNCSGNENGCIFSPLSKKKFFIIGDSHMASLAFDLKNRIVKKNYSFIITRGCLYFPGFNLVNKKTNKIDKNCNNEYFAKLEEVLKNQINSIIVFGGRFPLHLSGYRFDNTEGGIEGGEWDHKYNSVAGFETIQSTFKNLISNLSKQNKIILIYPIPEVGWNVPKIIINNISNKKLSSINKYIAENYITTSYDVYKRRTKSTFELFDSVNNENIFRVYPHTLFCDNLIKKRCIVYDNINIFYYDDNHPSTKGAEIINNLILKEIEKIELR